MLLSSPIYSLATNQQIFGAINFTLNFEHSIAIKTNDNALFLEGKRLVFLMHLPSKSRALLLLK